MPLQKVPIKVAFQGGIDTKTDQKQVLPGKLLDLQNAIFQNTGALNRRWGYTALGTAIIGTASSIAACKAVDCRFNNELLLFDGTNAYSFISADNAWSGRGGAVSVIQTNKQVIRNSSQQLSPDGATLGGIQVYAWEDSRGGIRYSVIDQASGAFVVVDQPLYAGMPSTLVRPRCVALSNTGNFIAIFFVMVDGSIGYVAINPLNPTAPPVPNIVVSALLASSPGVGVFIDVAPHPAGYAILLATGLLPPPFGTPLYFQLQLVAGVLTSTRTASAFFGGSTVAPIPSNAVSIDPFGNVWFCSTQQNTFGSFVTVSAYRVPPDSTFLGVFGGGAVRVMSFPINTVVQSVTIAFQGSFGFTGGTATIYAEVPGANGNIIYTNTVSSITGAVGVPIATPTVFARGVGLASKAFTFGTNTYVNVAFQSQQQSTYFTLDQNGNVVSKAISQLGGGYVSSSDYTLPNCQALSNGIFQYTNLVKGIVNTEAGAVQSLLGVNATTLDFFDSNSFLSAPINGGLYTVGGILQHYDGAQYTEAGFHVYPEAAVFTPSITGGAMAAGTYDYAITYEWVDNTGGTEISTPSLVTSVTIASGTTGSVQIVIPTLRLTKKSNVRIVVYRTTGASGTPGAILFRVTSALVPVYNSTTVDTITFTDTLADTSITSNGAMYTQPLTVGANPVLPNAAPPACSLIATFANRLFVSGVDDPYTIWYSQTAIVGSPMQFSALLTLRVDPDGGPITGIARMDDKLVIFKKDAIFYITGQGPTATGDQNDFGVPISVPSGGVGCVSSNSIVLTPMGLLFQSANGIWLLDRGLNVTYKGAPVEAYTLPTGGNLQITSATLVPNQWVIFTTTSNYVNSSGATEPGIALVYDYYYDQWSTFTNHSAVDSDLYIGGGNAFVWANAAGQVFQQNPTSFSDAGVPIKFRALTAKLNPSMAGGQLQGYQRIYHAFLLGTYKGSHSLKVSCLFDYDDTATALALIPVDATLGTGSTFGTASPFGIDSPFGGVVSGQTVYQFRLDILRKCQSVQFDITDSESSPGNEGFSLSALTLIVGVKQGGFKMPAIKQFGVS